MSDRILPEIMLRRPAHLPEQARFPVIDFHNHLFGGTGAEEMVQVMDQVGVKVFNNVTGNALLPYVNNTYTIERVDFDFYRRQYIDKYPGRFAAFTMSDFAQWGDFCLFRKKDFVESAISQLKQDVQSGARGLKITKELGLKFTDTDGELIQVNEERLFPIWQQAGKLGIPVLMHISDPVAFFEAPTPTNEHYQTLLEFPAWSFYGARYSKAELLEQRNRLIAAHPGTTFILPHVANHPEDLEAVAHLLERFPNVYIDFSARMDELGRQPYTAREFFMAYQDRILFGVDMPITAEIYRCYFRFLESRDEYFDYPDYIGRWGYGRWRIYGLHLPDPVLQKIYYLNAQRLLPDLKV
jgi:predicted TIM-barrel fold metal-dependent hydrolase